MSQTTSAKGSTLPFIVILLIAIGGLAAAAALYGRSLSLQAKLEGVRQELQQAKAKIAEMAPVVAQARVMPIEITSRMALLGNGYVVRFTNKGTKSLSLNVTATDATSKNTKTFRLVVDRGLGQEIGHAEGWPVASGDTFEITCAGYDPLTKKFN